MCLQAYKSLMRAMGGGRAWRAGGVRLRGHPRKSLMLHCCGLVSVGSVALGCKTKAII